MSLLVDDETLIARRGVARGSLAPLASSLAADLEPLLEGELYFPRHKALLSREGGRCARDGALLDFDPFAPHEHRCPRCDTVYRGELHDRFWIYWYQLWLAERAVHAAVLSKLGVDDRFAALAMRILEGYVDRYATYPNVDNVLGPTRLFFSTYLESIWLLQICIATDLLDDQHRALADRVLDRIIEPSRRTISEYDEGASNRQVWNDAALLAAAQLLGDADEVTRAIHGPSGVVSHLAAGLLADGTWFEGENYHLFAHRGLWYGVTMAERAGYDLSQELIDRFQLGFATPFLTALPDFTLPSRRDSQYAISLRQWRIAEHCELGLARSSNSASPREADSELIGALARMYDGFGERLATGRSNSSADVERNARPTALTRENLSWRALLCALPELPPLRPAAPRSVLLEGQGIAVFRANAGQSYVALDCGNSGGGHGHPDRLNLLIANGATRWLDDYGTGSYVDPSLHWYRSTLAHNAPLVDGQSQLRVNGQILGYESRSDAGWVYATASNIATGVAVARTLITLPEYVIDIVEWDADRDVTLDLPIHANVQLSAGVGPLIPAQLTGGAGQEDGFRFAHDTALQLAAPGSVVQGGERRDERSLALWSTHDRAAEWWRVAAPGPPSDGPRAFRLVRMRGRTGRLRTLFAWSDDVADVQFGEQVVVTLRDGAIHAHRRTDTGWLVEKRKRSVRQTVALGGMVAPSELHPAAEARARTATSPSLAVANDKSIVIELGEPHYRRSEEPWRDVRPTAVITLTTTANALTIGIDVSPSDLTFAADDAVNLFDNEPADVNGDGVQLYLQSESGVSQWMLVPETASNAVRVRPIEGSAGSRAVRATWRRTTGGYHMDVVVPAPLPLALDIIVNEMPRDRVRRRGQLVLSGANGEFVYLRGDRHDPSRFLRLQAADD